MDDLSRLSVDTFLLLDSVIFDPCVVASGVVVLLLYIPLFLLSLVVIVKHLVRTSNLYYYQPWLPFPEL